MELRTLATAGSWLSPLSLAAYLAWAAVWLGLGHAVEHDPLRGWLARACAVVFLIGFMAEDRIGQSLGERGFVALALLMAASALAPVGLAPYAPAPILMVLLAAVLAARYEGRALWIWLLALNLAMGLVMWRTWQREHFILITIIGYSSFQLFAALVMRYAMRAERAGEALRAAHAELLATRSLLAEGARDRERLRLARDLHDVAGHKLTALKLNLAALARDPVAGADPRTALCVQLADELLADIRGVVQAMRRSDGVDLAAAIRALGECFPRPRLELELAEDARPANLQQAEALLRAVQEALVNAARHSQANTLWVVLRREDGRLRLDLRDDGRGAGELRPGNGLRGMRERLEAAGGGLQLRRTETGGVHLQAWLPAVAG
ncbi:sensor histidine kinase [Arenimonas fontis]|nr:histidine kinase [Arenimonas fontis]